MTRAMNLNFLFLVKMVFLIMVMSPSVSATVPADWTVRSDLLDGVSEYKGLKPPVGPCGVCQFDLDRKLNRKSKEGPFSCSTV